MNRKLYSDAISIINKAIYEVQPFAAVKKALKQLDAEKKECGSKTFREKNGYIYVVAIGKAAWSMASAASEYLSRKIADGAVITKYNHSSVIFSNFRIFSESSGSYSYTLTIPSPNLVAQRIACCSIIVQ